MAGAVAGRAHACFGVFGTSAVAVGSLAFIVAACYLWKNVQRNLRATWLLLVAGHLRCEGGTIISAPARI